MADKKPKSSEGSHVQADHGSTSVGSVNVGGNVGGDIHIGNTIINYYTSGGEKREMRTGWFFGHRYGDLATFTGRATELKILDEWLANDTDNLLLMTAFGGFGKSALAWTWFNRVDREKWQTAIWWSFYEKESGFESFLSETLKHLGVEVKASARMQLNDLLEAMRGTNILIVLDGFERLLRQYGRMDAVLQPDDEDADIDPSQRDCSSPLTETFLRGLSGAGMKSKVLMTTRLCPRVLESADGKLLKGCREEPLAAFSPEDAVTYFHNEGVKATRAEITDACAAYGYHPLSLSLLVGLINEDHEHRGDIAAVKNLEIFENVKARRHHVLERAYESLASERRDLLSKISCFRGSMEYAILKKVFPSPDLDKALLDLRKRGLLQYAGESQLYDMHPIVRHYAYEFIDEQERKEIHTQIALYLIDLIPVGEIKKPEELNLPIELYYNMLRAGNVQGATLFYNNKLSEPIYYSFGYYSLEIELLEFHNIFLLRQKKIDTKMVGSLAIAYSANGQPIEAIQCLEIARPYEEENEDKRNLAMSLGNCAAIQIQIGSLRKAEEGLRKQIGIALEKQDVLLTSFARQVLGRLFMYQGYWRESQQELKLAEITANGKLFRSLIPAFQSMCLLLNARYLKLSRNLSSEMLLSAINLAKQAVDYAIDDERIARPVAKDFVRANWILGSAYRVNSEFTLSENHLYDALARSRSINNVEHEADILLDIARLRYAQGDFKDALEKASEALVITERSGYVLQGADVNLFLAQYALEQEKDKAKAKQYAESALRLAYCDGPPYYYKVAYEEAERMLEKL